MLLQDNKLCAKLLLWLKFTHKNIIISSVFTTFAPHFSALVEGRNQN